VRGEEDKKELMTPRYVDIPMGFDVARKQDFTVGGLIYNPYEYISLKPLPEEKYPLFTSLYPPSLAIRFTLLYRFLPHLFANGFVGVTKKDFSLRRGK
jgi:hypothetical protein